MSSAVARCLVRRVLGVIFQGLDADAVAFDVVIVEVVRVLVVLVVIVKLVVIALFRMLVRVGVARVLRGLARLGDLLVTLVRDSRISSISCASLGTSS